MRRGLLVLPLAVGLLLASCGGEDAACTEIREPQDPASGIHLLDFDDVEWQSDPPTSGPHLSAPTPRGVLVTPLDYPMQVTVLEAGQVMVQYDASLTDDERAGLEALAGEGTVVAPADELPERIVATAWTWKLTCDSVDEAALTEFITVRPGDAPGHG